MTAKTIDAVDCGSSLGACPFHSNESTVSMYLETSIDGQRFRVGCSYCGTLGPLTHSKEEAVIMWNSAKR